MNKYSLAERINTEINASVKYMTDIEHYGLIEKWSIPDGYGDCEDYALRKRVRLIEAGWGTEDVTLCTCNVETGEGHCVVWVNTDRGGVILDNRYEWPMEPSSLPYKWISILKGGVWYELSGWQ